MDAGQMFPGHRSGRSPDQALPSNIHSCCRCERQTSLMMRPWLLALFLMIVGGAYLVRAQDEVQPDPATSTAEPEPVFNATEPEPESTAETVAETTPSSTAHACLHMLSYVVVFVVMVMAQ